MLLSDHWSRGRVHMGFVVSLNCVDGWWDCLIIYHCSDLGTYYMSLFQIWVHIFLILYLDMFKYIQMHSLQHPEVFFGAVNDLWAGQLRICGSTAPYSLTWHIGMQTEHRGSFLATVFFCIHYKSFLPYKTRKQIKIPQFLQHNPFMQQVGPLSLNIVNQYSR